MRNLYVHKSDNPTRQQKKNHGAKYEREAAVDECQTKRNQRSSHEDENASPPLLSACVKSRMRRMEIHEQQSQGNQIQHQQHDESSAENGRSLRLLHHCGQDEQFATAHQDGRVCKIASHPTCVFPTCLRVGAEQDTLVGSGAEGG